jgi:hypothetical protein
MKDAALAAGYAEKWANRAGSQASRQIQNKMPDLFAELGLDDRSFIEKHILPALNAKEVKVFHDGDEVVYSKPLIAWATRTATNRLVAEMKGMLVKEQEAPRYPIKVIVLDPSHRPPVRPTNGQPKVLDIPGMEPPKP